MEIKTKYSIKDTVYYLDNNEIKSFKIYSIAIRHNSYYDQNVPQQIETYSSDQYGQKDFFNSDNLYPSVEELLKSLQFNFKNVTKQ